MGDASLELTVKKINFQKKKERTGVNIPFIVLIILEILLATKMKIA